ncbi:MAG: 16S rRNA (cytidine(1402)-2'-O)-methyltransferase [Bacteroidetes bacterium]|nr:16S rRNA (cytidine(1402)-2'-O)-methyltransferase [Bacteroidota bacterium]
MSKLTLVPTPVGNLGDITLRALEVLKETDLVLAEDTRKTGLLLKHFQISRPIRSHHKFNEHGTLESLLSQLASGTSMAMVTDAGTPGISDPGFLLVRACIEKGIPVETLPGATAFVPALVNSGIPCDRFVFEGFLPAKKGRNKRFTELSSEKRTMVFYESPYRVEKTLRQMAEYFGTERRASVSREISKLHEENARGTLIEIADHFGGKQVKGEIVIVVTGAESGERQATSKA